MNHRPTPPGQSGCVCAACWHVFNSPSAFDKHQPRGTCADPEQLGMVMLREHQGRPVWGLSRRTDLPARTEEAA
ncbi:hypothetical protein [Streptomonospora arabica]|uniref:Phage FDXHR zinc binding domain-containing protein n=1 Tax=Streptomonospora arabica TaxID=412417 RepID=A0ABV9SSJ9_9ACTN